MQTKEDSSWGKNLKSFVVNKAATFLHYIHSIQNEIYYKSMQLDQRVYAFNNMLKLETILLIVSDGFYFYRQ